jgi:predicted outer membrane repeat protein
MVSGSKFSDLTNLTAIQCQATTKLQIENVSVSGVTGGSGFNASANCDEMSIRGSTFEKVSNGGVQLEQSTPVSIIESTFRECARVNGAGIYAPGARELTILESTFDQNKAKDSGAGVYVGCNESDLTGCKVTLSDLKFTGNKATKGGGIYYSNKRPDVIEKVSNEKNEAFYGPDIASYATAIKRYLPESRRLQA